MNMYERAKQFTLSIPLLRRSVGLLIFTIGLFALVTPFTPGGIIFTIVGLELLGIKWLYTKKLKERLWAKKIVTKSSSS